MAIQLTEMKTPKGITIMRMDSLGSETAEDARELTRLFGPGGPYHGRGMLLISNNKFDLTPDARRAFVEMRRLTPITTAMVMSSAATRVAVNFIIRAADALKKSEKEARSFPNEAEALAWLDEKLSA